jgi:ProP effector
MTTSSEPSRTGHPQPETAQSATAQAETISPVQNARSLLKELQQKFAPFRDYSPLAIGIDKQLQARLPEINRKVLRVALGLHTNSTRYLKSMSRATARVDLDGNPGEEITEAHRKHALEVLRERFKKEAELKKAQRQAEEASRKEEEAARQRTEKLNQLAAKFSRK